MSAPKWKHRPCPCGCGELADECMKPGSALNAFRIEQPARPTDAGCCHTCSGTGRTYDSSTGGMCWDCRGSGCAHEGRCSA